MLICGGAECDLACCIDDREFRGLIVPVFQHEPVREPETALAGHARPADAAEALRKTEELAPGWFHCRADLWLAEQIVLGNLPQEIYPGLRALEDAPGTPEQKMSLAELEGAKCPELALLHLHHGLALADLERPDEAAVAFRQGLRVAREPDVQTRLLSQLAAVLPAGKERVSMLTEAAALKGNLVAAATAAYMLRSGA